MCTRDPPNHSTFAGPSPSPLRRFAVVAPGLIRQPSPGNGCCGRGRRSNALRQRIQRRYPEAHNRCARVGGPNDGRLSGRSLDDPRPHCAYVPRPPSGTMSGESHSRHGVKEGWPSRDLRSVELMEHFHAKNCPGAGSKHSQRFSRVACRHRRKCSGHGTGTTIMYCYYTYPHVAWCEQRYRSYDPATGTYLGYDGFRHACP